MRVFFIAYLIIHLNYFFFIRQRIISTQHRIFIRHRQARVFTVIPHQRHSRLENPRNQLNQFIYRVEERH